VASVSADSNGNSSFETSRKAHHGIENSVTVHFLAALQFRKKIDTRRNFVGVHALGQGATEIIHIGQAVLFYGDSVENFRDMVFNYPTLAEAHKVAALDGLNKL
jgi:pyruvate/2-oxoglutarate dehydrogenase complex dihydrolipoamide dehydrogenase (E3) component